MLTGGAAKVDITPEPGLLMSGYIARSQVAAGSHDPLTVRAVVLNDTALLVCDVIGMHEDMSQRIRHQAPLPADNIVIAALHTHGAPASMTGRLHETPSPHFLERLEAACIEVIALAQQQARPCTLRAGYAKSPGIAINRRHPGGAVDDLLPVLTLLDENQLILATIVSYACHPVVLGADNLHYTADYPHYVRSSLEAHYPGSIALFITGAAGDANSGHLAKDSLTTAANENRTFDEAQRIGERIASCATSAQLDKLNDTTLVTNSIVSLSFSRRETAPPNALSTAWQEQLSSATGVKKRLLQCWIDWAEHIAPLPLNPWNARISIMNWGGIKLVALPGEIFASTAHQIRTLLDNSGDIKYPVFIVAYAEGNPGYIPPAEEFNFGGYEIDEAHRFYGLPATFAADSIERILRAVNDCLALQQPD